METTMYVLNFELRYNKLNSYKSDMLYVYDKTQIEIYDTEAEAVKAGNEFLRNVVAKYFKVEEDDYLSDKKNLVSNACQPDCKIIYFVEVRKLRFADAVEMCLDALDAVKELREWSEARENEDED